MNDEIDALRKKLGEAIKEKEDAQEKLKNIKAAIEVAQKFVCTCPTCIVLKAATELLTVRVPSV